MPGETRRAGRILVLGVSFLLLSHLLLAATGIRKKSPVFDEMTHQTAGMSFWLHNDYRLQPDNGNLPSRLAALLLVFSRPCFPDADSDLWKNADLWKIGYSFHHLSGNDPLGLVFYGRMAMMLLSLALGIAVFLWSRSLFGDAGGLVSLALYAFCPLALALAPLMTSDMAAALFFLLSTGALWRVSLRASPTRLVLAGLSVGCLLASKPSGVLIAFVAGLLFLARLASAVPLEVAAGKGRAVIRGRFPRAAALLVSGTLVFALGFSVLWGFYGFRYNAFVEPPGGAAASIREFDGEKPLEKAGMAAKPIRFFREHRLLPEAYLQGLAMVAGAVKLHPAFMNGRYSVDGWWTFFPFAFAVKTPIPTLAVLVLALAALLGARGTWPRLVPLGALFLVYGAFSLSGSLNIGLRHILPLYPVLFILAGAVVRAGSLARARRVATAGLVAGLAVTSLAAWPDFLSYFNPLAGGSKNGYRLLVDSSLDWGQDLPALRELLDREKLEGPVYLAYFGSASPWCYGIRARTLAGCVIPHVFGMPRPDPAPLEPGTYCISATLFQQVYTATFGRWCREYEDRYQAHRKVFLRYLAAREDPGALELLAREEGGPDRLADSLWSFQLFRFGRLCQHLRTRVPDAMARGSILVFRVTREDLEKALEGPPAVLYPDAGIKGYPGPGRTPGVAVTD